MDLDNIAEVTHLAVKFNMLAASGLNAVERSNARQALGEEIERRALDLIAEVRRERGFHEFDSQDARALVPDDEPEAGQGEEEVALPALTGPFNGAKVRDCMVKFREGFIIPELAASLDAPLKEVKRFVEIWARTGNVKPTGFKVGRHVQYEWVKPQGTVNRERALPPERSTPGTYGSAHADGQAVRRAAIDKLDKRSRSTAGIAHAARQRDRRYEEIQQGK